MTKRFGSGMETPAEMHKILAQNQTTVHALAFSNNGEILAASTADKTIRLWNLAKGQVWLNLEGHQEIARALAFSTDGTLLASGSDDKTIKVWDSATGQIRATLSGHGASVVSLAFSADSKTLYSASEDKTVKLWDLATNQMRLSMEGSPDGVPSIAVSLDGKTLAMVGGDGTIRLRDAVNGKPREAIEVGPRLGIIHQVEFTPDGRHVATVNGNGTVFVLRLSGSRTDVATNAKLPDPNRGHAQAGYQVSTPPREIEAAKIPEATIPAKAPGTITGANSPEASPTEPEYLTPERRKANLLVDGSFEENPLVNWQASSWSKHYAGKPPVIDENTAKAGKRSVVIRSKEYDDCCVYQKCACKPHTRYLLCGWVKTENVEDEHKGTTGARLCVREKWDVDVTRSPLGTNDWTYLTCLWNSEDRTSVEIAARLGYYGCVAKGTAWFDDLCLIELEAEKASGTVSRGVGALTSRRRSLRRKEGQVHQEAWAKHLGVPVEMSNSIGMKMAMIPAGEFLMGSPENEEGGLRKKARSTECESQSPSTWACTR